MVPLWLRVSSRTVNTLGNVAFICDLASVDELSLLFLRMYFSRASASCSRTLLAIGDRTEAGLMTEALVGGFAWLAEGN